MSKEVKPVEPIKLLKKYKEYPNIIEHSKAVARVALLIAKLINQHSSSKINLEDVKNAALLHDIDKTLTLKENRKKAERICEKLNIDKRKIKHAVLGYEILKREGLKKYAVPTRQHTYFKIITSDRPKTLLSKIIYYADKRCEGDKIVPLKKRLDIWDKRYSKMNDAKTNELVKKANQEIYKLEKELLKKMGITLKEFDKKIREAKL